MQTTRGIALVGFEQALLRPTDRAPKIRLTPFGKILFALLFLSLAFLALPRSSTAELTLTDDNLIEIINQDRDKWGLQAYKKNPLLTRAAEDKARDIFKNSYFAHFSPEGTAPWDFIKAQGLNYSFAGENLAINYLSAYELEKDFLQSPSHRENVLSPVFSEIGIAVVSGTFEGQPAVITVQMFAAPAGTLAHLP